MLGNFYLLKDIDFTSDYKHVVRHATIQLQEQYFEKRKVYGYPVKVNYLKSNSPQIVLDIPVDIVKQYSYFTYTNFVDGREKTFYAFIIDSERNTNDTSYVQFRIDIWQTYMFDFELQDSFIEREHQDRFKKVFSESKLEQTYPEYIPIFNEELENIEIGEDLVIVDRETILEPAIEKAQIDFKDELFLFGKLPPIHWIIIIASDKLMTDNLGGKFTYRKIANSFYVYMIPFLNDKGNRKYEFYTSINNEVKRLHTMETFVNSNLFSDTKIITMRFMAYSPIKYEIINVEETTAMTKITMKFPHDQVSHHSILIDTTLGQLGVNFLRLRELKTGSENIDFKTFNFKYNFNNNVNSPCLMKHEPKLFIKPYRSYIVTNYQTEPLMFKENNAQGKTLKILNSIDINGKTKVYLDDYLNDNGKHYSAVDTKLNELPLMTEAFKEYYKQNRATATTGLAVNMGMSMLGLGATIPLLSSGMLMIPLGFMALNQGVNSGKQVYGELMQQSNLKETPDSSRQSGNNLNFDLLDSNTSYEVVKREIKPYYKERVFEYFKRYGYKTNLFKKPKLDTRYHYNFIKCLDVNLTGKINDNIKTQLKGIFQNGVTIWHNRDINKEVVMYDYSKENVEMSLI